MKIKRGSTSVRRLIFIADSASTTGAGLANLTHSSSGLVAWYFAGDLSNDVQITLATASLGTWTSGGFVAVDNTNMPGWYEIGIPNAALDGGNECSIQLRGAANMVPVNIYIELDAFDYQVATQPVNVTQFGGTAGTFDAGKPTAVLDSSSLRSALGMSAADLDAQLDAILAAASAGAGTGARTVTITVNDGTTALQNAVVRLTEGVNTFRALTNASGVATFNLDDATYTVAITKSGYSYAGTTLVVDGTETRTYSMTVVSITPPDGPTKTVLTILCLDENGDADSGVNVSIRYVTVPTDSVDIAFPGASITKTSNGSGVATFQVIKGATIEYKRGTRDVWLESTMSDEDTTSITSFIGTP